MTTATLTSPELKETEAKLDAKRAELATIYREAGPDLDMSKVKSVDGDSAAKVAAIRALDTEINDFAAKAEELRDLLKIGQRVLDEENDPSRKKTERGTNGDGGDPPVGKSLGEQFTKSAAFKTKGVESDLDVDLKTLLSTSAGWAPEPFRSQRVVDYITRPLELLDLVPMTTTTAGSLTYWEETTFTNAAIEVAEGEPKPEATLALTERTETVRKIAVWLPVTDEQLDDERRVQAYLNRRLPFMLRQRLELQIVVGNGTAPNISGFLDRAIQTQAKGADPTPDAVYKAMTKVRVGGQAMPDAYVTNPNDWQDVRLLRTLDGIYIWGSPSEAGPERIWGLRVVQLQAMTENTGLVGDFGNFSELAMRQNVTMKTTDSHGEYFISNKQVFLAELRAALLVYRPYAYCSVTGI